MLGSGTELDPYQVETASDLNAVRDNLTAFYIQMANIDLSGYSSWTPIGEYDSGQTWVNAFKGNYNGSNFTISYLTINNTSDIYCMGLFGVADGSNISNVNLINVNISTTYYYAGALIGYANTCTIDNCIVAGTIQGIDTVGGLIGIATYNSLVSNCNANITVVGIDGTPTYVQNIGGLIGLFGDHSTITNCFSIGNISKTGTKMALYWGGLIGQTNGNNIISSCYSTISIDGIGSGCTFVNIGGLIGIAFYSLDIEKSYATGNISGRNNIGGLIGNCTNPSVSYNSYITDCYATGSVIASLYYAAGLTANITRTTITNCYSVGQVTAPSYIGGLCVNPPSTTVVYVSCYYDTDTSGQSDNDGRGIPKTTLEMKIQSTFTDWNFTTIWNINGTTNNGYPFLRTGTIPTITVNCVSQGFPYLMGAGKLISFRW